MLSKIKQDGGAFGAVEKSAQKFEQI